MRLAFRCLLLLSWMGPGLALAPVAIAAEIKEHLDPHSYSRPSEISIRSLSLDLNVDFGKKIISGSVTFELDNKTNSTLFYLDTKDLTIKGVKSGSHSLSYKMGNADPLLGQALIISISDPLVTKQVTVEYEASSSAAALHWLDAGQTISKKHPFLFTLNEPISARTWFPCLDTPAVRVPYRARIQTPKDVLALMSARNPKTKNGTGIYEFEMPEPVPSYLVALAVGDLEFQNLGKRTGIYAEPGIVKAAAWEFEEADKFLDAAEKIYGDFLWERSDILILPYAFAYGGMENPRLTYLNASTVVGDRSMTNLLAHEDAHYWTGGAVLPANWNHFWLNEGITSYAEVRILESIYGKTLADQMAHRNLGELHRALHDLKDHTEDTRLRVDYTGRDPGDAINDVAYQKPAFFFRLLEEKIGRDRTDAFIRKYIERFKFQSITTQDFVTFFNETVIAGDAELAQEINLAAWIDAPALPNNMPAVNSTRVSQIEATAQKWKKGTSAYDISVKGWQAFDWQNFLDILGSEVPADRMEELDRGFQISQVKNPEVRFRWLRLVIENKYREEYPACRDFLLLQGRGKYVKPLFTALKQTPEGTAMAEEILKQKASRE